MALRINKIPYALVRHIDTTLQGTLTLGEFFTKLKKKLCIVMNFTYMPHQIAFEPKRFTALFTNVLFDSLVNSNNVCFQTITRTK